MGVRWVRLGWSAEMEGAGVPFAAGAGASIELDDSERVEGVCMLGRRGPREKGQACHHVALAVELDLQRKTAQPQDREQGACEQPRQDRCM